MNNYSITHTWPTEKPHTSMYDIFLCLQLFFVGMQFFVQNNTYIYLSGIVGLLAIVYWLINFKNRVFVQKATLVILLTMLLMFINYLFWGNYPLLSIFREPTSYMSIALMLLGVCQNRKFYFGVFIVAALFVIYRMSLIGFDFSHDTIFTYSRNYLSLYVFIFNLPYYYACSRDHEKASNIPVIICFGLSLITLGRGNIISSLLWFILIGLKYVVNSKGRGRFGYLIITLVFALALVYFMTSDFANNFLYRFEDRAMEDDARFQIIQEYWSTIVSGVGLIFGCRLNSIPLVAVLEHLHNSYLMLHCFMGLGGILLLFVGIYRCFKSLYKSHSFDLLILLTVFVFRSFSDWYFPIHNGSILMWFIVLYPMLISYNKTK